jgi:hypothetical protein
MLAPPRQAAQAATLEPTCFSLAQSVCPQIAQQRLAPDCRSCTAASDSTFPRVFRKTTAPISYVIESAAKEILDRANR